MLSSSWSRRVNSLTLPVDSVPPVALAVASLCLRTGDALGIYPLNNPPEVAVLLAALGHSGEAPVPVPKMAYEPKPEKDMPLKTALAQYYDLKTVQPSLINLIRNRTTDATEKANVEELLREGGASINKNKKLKKYVGQREVADVLEEFSSVVKEERISTNDILANMKILQPRYYSISSSPVIGRIPSVCSTPSELIILYVFRSVRQKYRFRHGRRCAL